LLPVALNLTSMIEGAGPVVQAVIILLTIASIASWTAWLAISIDLAGRRRALQAALAKLADQTSLKFPVPAGSPDLDLLIAAVRRELDLSRGTSDRQGQLDRLALTFERIEAAAGRRVAGIGWIGTVGATTPFIGLFGTVWGIMNSFIGISQAHTTNLAVVAPGIAEALLTTAMGLIAAIPAVIFYNLLTRSLNAFRGTLGDAAATLLQIVSRDMSLGSGGD